MNDTYQDLEGYTKPMETKYFTPSIEDIRVGYECEYLSKEKVWIEGVIGKTLFLYKDIVEVQDLRVPYLTKEQIEAEGWTVYKGPMLLSFSKKDKGSVQDWIIWYSEFSHMLNIQKGTRPMWLHTYFNGECKDINTFRYICTLLGI